jgi:hypothetical protein
VKGATINGVTCEGVAEFVCLDTLINNNSIEREIQRHILAGSRTYFAAVSLFRSRLLSRASKIYKTLIGSIPRHIAWVWSLVMWAVSKMGSIVS